MKLPACKKLSFGEIYDKLLIRLCFARLMNQRGRPAMIPSGDAVLTLTAPVAAYAALNIEI
jgi:hypothetical protein